VVGVGATVRRPASAGTGFVGDLLKVFEASGWQNTRLVAARRSQESCVTRATAELVVVRGSTV
jgi:hypothetical protein